MIAHASALFAVFVVVALRRAAILVADSPDCRIYEAMSKGRRAPRPYHARVLIPVLSRLTRIRLDGLVLIGTLASILCVYGLTLHLGGSSETALVAALVFACTQSTVGLWLFYPKLVDSWSVAFAVLAAMLGPIPAAVFLALSAATKEAGFVLGAIFCLLSGMPFWVAIPGAVVAVALQFAPSSSPFRSEQASPITEAFARKQGIWFDYKRTLSGMHSTPWIAAAVLPGAALSVPALAVVAASSVQTLVAVDHSRLIAMSLPWVVPIVAVSCPEWLLWPWVLSVAFWPFEAHAL